MKIKQITAGTDDVFALCDDGIVYRLSRRNQCWEALPEIDADPVQVTSGVALRKLNPAVQL